MIHFKKEWSFADFTEKTLCDQVIMILLKTTSDEVYVEAKQFVTCPDCRKELFGSLAIVPSRFDYL